MEVREAAIDPAVDVYVYKCNACVGNIFVSAAMYNHLFLMTVCLFFFLISEYEVENQSSSQSY